MHKVKCNAIRYRTGGTYQCSLFKPCNERFTASVLKAQQTSDSSDINRKNYYRLPDCKQCEKFQVFQQMNKTKQKSGLLLLWAIHTSYSQPPLVGFKRNENHSYSC